MLSSKAILSTVFCLVSLIIVLTNGNDTADYWTRFAENLNRDINQRLSNELQGLNNLGATINQQVHNGLRPVREMQFRFRIKFGNDGTTIATFKDRTFIIRNGVMYECDGTISDRDGTCSGTLKKAVFKTKKDYCYANVNTIVNNWCCISNGGVNVAFSNGHISCESVDDSPTLLITTDEYRSVCGGEGNPVTYKYFTNKPLGDYGPEVQCSGGPPYTCTMTENRSLNVGRSIIQVSQTN